MFQAKSKSSLFNQLIFFNFIDFHFLQYSLYRMQNTIRPKSTHLKHRSFCMDKKSTISTKETSRSLIKSFAQKSNFMHSIQKIPKKQLMSQSMPIETYFNPQYKGQYLKKMIDTFFDSLNPQSQGFESINMKRSDRLSKLSIRSHMKGWKRKNKIISDFSQLNTSKFIRSSPQKSILSDLSQQKSLAIIDEHNNAKQQELARKQSDDQLMSNLDSISIVANKKPRPFSQQIKKRKFKQMDQQNTNNSVTVSLFFNQGSSPRDKLRKEVRKLIFQNEYFEQFGVVKDGKIESRIRKYKNQNNPLFQRQDKIHKRGIKTYWKYTKFPLTLQYPMIKSLKQLISQQFNYGSGTLDSYIQIYPKPYYYELFLNKNEELIDIIVSMTKFIIKNKGKVLTNAFNVKNIHKTNQKQFYLKDLGTSAIVEEIQIRQKIIRHLYQPVWKQEGQTGNWIMRPEYLSPELLESYQNLNHSWIEQNPQLVIASQIWSLGCMLLELLTLIPLNSDVRCRVKSNQDNLRRGFLSIKFNEKNVDFKLLERKQKSLQAIFHKKLYEQLSRIKIQRRVVEVLKKMLIFEPKDRIKPDQILQQLHY